MQLEFDSLLKDAYLKKFLLDAGSSDLVIGAARLIFLLHLDQQEL